MNNNRFSFFSFRRTMAIMIKEFIQLKRDFATLQMIVFVPVMQLLLFGYALNNDPHHLPAAVISGDNGQIARSFIAGLNNSDYFSIDYEAASGDQALRLLRQGKVNFIINIPENFSRDVIRGDSPTILIQADATDSVAIAAPAASLSGILKSVIKKDFKGSVSSGASSSSPVNVILHKMYNPEGFTNYNIIPGMIAILLTMTGIMMTALSVTKERERGTMENILAMPVRPLEVMTGKIVPYILIGYVQSFIVISLAKYLFDVPVIGSMWLMAGAIFVFIACNMALGFSLSVASRNQTQALQLSITIILPSIMLSGFIFPFRGMPLWARIIGDSLPATHFIRISRGILLKGNGMEEIWPDLWPLMVFMLVITVISMKLYRKTLD